MVCTHRVDRARPPGHHEAKQAGHDHAGQRTDAELEGQPTRAGDTLSPRQAEGAGLELLRDERRPPNTPMRRGPQGGGMPERLGIGPSVSGERSGSSRAVMVHTEGEGGGVIEVDEVRPVTAKTIATTASAPKATAAWLRN